MGKDINKMIAVAKKDKIIKYKNKNIAKNLLLSYIYFLNENHTCKICIGFDIENYKPMVIFHRIGKNIIEIEYQDWIEHYTKYRNYYENTSLHRKGMFLKFGKVENKKKFYINQEEYEYFINIVDLIQAVTKSYSYATPSLNEYITKYINKCITKNVNKLGQADFYIPMNLQIAQCNLLTSFL